jgi:hypothetical protein
MSQRYYTNKPDVENLENAASTIQREEQKVEETTRPGGPGIYYIFFFLHGNFKLIINHLFLAAKAKSFADRAADVYDEPKISTINRPVERNPKPSPQAVDDAARTIQREEAKNIWCKSARWCR